MNVSLAEVLRVRGGPLQEEEVWAVLNQSVDCLNELLRRDSSELGFIISPWSLLLMPSGNISFTQENVTQEDLRAFTAPELLQGLNISSLSDMEKMHMYSLGMTLFWGADYAIPQSQPIKLGEHLNSILLSMCGDSSLSRLSVRSVLDTCSSYIRNSKCEPSFSYIRRLVRLVLGSLSQLDGLLTQRENLPERSKEIRERLRGKGLPGRSAAHRVLERYRARAQEQANLNRALSRSMDSLSIQNLVRPDEGVLQYSDFHAGSESSAELYHQRQQLQHRRGRPMETDQRFFPHLRSKGWASSADLVCLDPDMISFGNLEDARRGNSVLSSRSAGRHKSSSKSRDFLYSDLDVQNTYHSSSPSINSAFSGAYEQIREKQRKLQAMKKAKNDSTHAHRRNHSDYSSSSESPSVTSSDHDCRQGKKPEEVMRFGSDQDVQRHRLLESGRDELTGTDVLIQRQEETRKLQAQLSRASAYSGDDPRTSILDLMEPFHSSSLDAGHQLRKPKNFLGPEFVKMSSEPCVVLNVPSSIMNKPGKGEETQRKVGVVLLSGQRLEVWCDLRAVCKDVLDMVIAHVGLVEHHLFSLAYLKDNEFFFVEPDAKLSKVAPDSWKDNPRKKKTDVNFNLFLRIKFFQDDVNLIEHAMTKHQYYLQLRRDLLEERVRCHLEDAVILASLALQAEFGDYQPELHGKTYFRMEDYLPGSVLDINQTTLREQLSKLHSSHLNASEEEAELEFLKVSQRLMEYGVHFHHVLPEKRSQTGIMLGLYSKGVLIFEVLNGNRTPVLRFPWRDTKKISFTKKKICLQNSSDKIKHLFHTDSQKTCQYLLQLCWAQYRFHLLLKTRQNNQQLQDLENCPLHSLQFSGGTGADSLSPTDPEPYKRISHSEMFLNKSGSGWNAVSPQSSDQEFSSSSRMKSRSHHNLGQLLESPQPRVTPFGSQSQSGSMRWPGVASSHHRASSDTDSIIVSKQQEGGVFGPAVLNSPSWNPKILKKSDSSSGEDVRHGDSLKQKVEALPSPEQEKQTINMRNDVKHGLGSPSDVQQYRSHLSAQKQEVGVDSEEHAAPPSPSLSVSETSPPQSIRQDSGSSRDSWMESTGPQPTQYNGFAPKGTTAARLPPADITPMTEVTPPALPPKTRKSRVTDIPAEQEYPDRGHSEMEEDTSSRHKQISKQALSLSSVTDTLNASSSDVSSLQPGDLFDLELSKKNSSLGISVTGGSNTAAKHGGLYVKSVIPEGAAQLDGRIKKGDRLVAVNGKSLEGATHRQAVEMLRDTGQVVHLLLERVQPLADKDNAHAHLTPQGTTKPQNNTQSADPQQSKPVHNAEYGFITAENTFEVGLLKNTSGLGFSFSREENIPGEPPGSSMVRVKKLFPGQPASESGRIEVGDIILRVNQMSLKGLSQHEVISALRGAGQEVTLQLCRPEISPTITKEPQPDPSRSSAAQTECQRASGPVEEALERLLIKSPSRRNSYSDSTDCEEPEEQISNTSVCQTPAGELGSPQPLSLENTYSPRGDPESSALCMSSPSVLPVGGVLSPSQVPHPPPLTTTVKRSHTDHAQEEEFVPEVELRVSLEKSDKGSLGFTLIKENSKCYIHEIIQDPARGDGRLRPGDRVIMVNNKNVSGMSHTEVVNLVRFAPKVVDLVVGRVLELPNPPMEAHLLPEITFRCHSEALGLVLDGGRDSRVGVLYVRNIIPGSVAAAEGSLRALDVIHYISGAPTHDLPLSESCRLLQQSLKNLTLKATRNGKPVFQSEKISLLNNNVSPKVSQSTNMNGYLHSNSCDELESLSSICPAEEQIVKLNLEKPPAGELGFSVIGGERGIFIKSITPGGTADTAGTLQVGDRLLKVNEDLMVGISHFKAVTTLRKMTGLVHLVVSRPPDQMPNTYLSFLPPKPNGAEDDSDVIEDSRVGLQTPSEQRKSHSPPPLPPIDYDAGSLEKQRVTKGSVVMSEDTFCDGSSLPEDSPETPRKVKWKEENVDSPLNDSALQSSAQPDDDDDDDDDDITWGSDELPTESINSKFTKDGLIVTEDKLTSLPVVKVVPDGRYTSSSLSSVVHMMEKQLEQKVPLQEFENLQNLQPLDECLIGQTTENRKKNRYKNIVPYDTTRVTLGTDGGYINANFIKMPVKDENFLYIACQGPLPTTLGDFWQMVWEQKSNVIAMMTQEMEGGKVKCHRYWPDIPRSPEMVGERLQVTLVKDQHLDNFVIRLMELKDVKTNEIQRVTHLNFTGWPDHGTPTRPEQLLTFISYMRHIYQSGPIITHCSAGIGRSGTLICIDVVLGLISKDEDFDISGVVGGMRLQRHGMVQTEDQYVFCYHVMLYVLRCLQAEEEHSG